VGVGIPTFRRPEELSQLLPAVVAQCASVLASGLAGTCTIVVVDNEPNDTNRNLVLATRTGQVEVKYVPEERRGLATARNRLLRQAAGQIDLLACLDDDEMPGEGWLSALLKAQSMHSADVVAGPVVPERILSHADPSLQLRPHHPAGQYRGHVGAGNVLLRTAFFSDRGLEFDHRFSESGGEDTHFFWRSSRLGAKIVWAPSAEVSERVPDSRLRVRWLASRAFANAATYTLIEREMVGSAVSVPRVAGRCALGAVKSLQILLGIVPSGRRRATAGLVNAAWACGRAYGLVGRGAPRYGHE